jgi:hypothetical protein
VFAALALAVSLHIYYHKHEVQCHAVAESANKVSKSILMVADPETGIGGAALIVGYTNANNKLQGFAYSGLDDHAVCAGFGHVMTARREIGCSKTQAKLHCGSSDC